MQVKKDDVRCRIISVAHDEFVRNGVKNTSMRTIAKLSGVALGNIYKYFESKDKILCAVLAPLLKALDEYMQYHNSREHLVIDFSSVEQMQKQMMSRLLELIGQFRAELKLLFFNVEGTSLEGYRDRLYIVCSMWTSALFEIVKHEELTEAEITKFFAEYFEFSVAGWRKLMKA